MNLNKSTQGFKKMNLQFFAQNYASKYSKKVDERFYLNSMTDRAVNKDYEFIGVVTVNVYSVDVAAMNDYARTGTNRYGTPTDLGTGKQELTLTKDRSFTFVIDRGDYTQSQMVTESGKALARQIDEVVTPEIDVYRLGVMGSKAVADGNTAVAVITASNAYEKFLDGNANVSENKAPMKGRIAYVSPVYYKFLKLDNSFIRNSELGQKKLITGQVGEVDGVAIVMVPSTYLPTNASFLITHKIATTAPCQLKDYKIHNNPPGINGWLVEGRIIYDAFVLSNKANALWLHTIA